MEFSISSDMKHSCCFGQSGIMCNIISFTKTVHSEGYFLKEIPFIDYVKYEKICKFSGLDYVTDIIELDTTVMIMDRIEKLENAIDCCFSALGGCIIRCEPRS